jgi:hypothetical protein
MIAAPALVALSRPLDKVAPLARVGANDAPGSPSREWWSYFASYDDRAIISCVFLFLLLGLRVDGRRVEVDCDRRSAEPLARNLPVDPRSGPGCSEPSPRMGRST